MRVQQRRKHPLPMVREAQGQGLFLLAHGEPHDPCPGGRVSFSEVVFNFFRSSLQFQKSSSMIFRSRLQ